MAFADTSWAGRATSACPAWRRVPFVTAFFVWFGIHGFRKMEKSFADLI